MSASISLMTSSGPVSPERSVRSVSAQAEVLDPLLVEAAADVDRTLIRWALSLSHRERLRASTKATKALSRIRRDPA